MELSSRRDSGGPDLLHYLVTSTTLGMASYYQPIRATTTSEVQKLVSKQTVLTSNLKSLANKKETKCHAHVVNLL